MNAEQSEALGPAVFERLGMVQKFEDWWYGDFGDIEIEAYERAEEHADVWRIEVGGDHWRTNPTAAALEALVRALMAKEE